MVLTGFSAVARVFMRYVYKGEFYEFGINGQTGKMSGNFPLSELKCFLYTAASVIKGLLFTAAINVGIILIFKVLPDPILEGKSGPTPLSQLICICFSWLAVFISVAAPILKMSKKKKEYKLRKVGVGEFDKRGKTEITFRSDDIRF